MRLEAYMIGKRGGKPIGQGGEVGSLWDKGKKWEDYRMRG